METEPVDRTETDGRAWRYVAVAVLLTVVGVVASGVLSIPAFALPEGSLSFLVAAVLLSELGYVLVALVFLAVTRRGLSYLDLSVSWSWVPLVAGVVLALSVLRLVVLLGAAALGVEAAPSAIVGLGVPLGVLLPVMLVASLLIIGPAEELLFRGVVQKYLRERFSATTAILGAGLLFGSIHVLALVQSTGVGTALSLVVITLVGLAIGWLYERTGSLVAAMVAHGVYNALVFGLAYVLFLLGMLGDTGV